MDNKKVPIFFSIIPVPADVTRSQKDISIILQTLILIFIISINNIHRTIFT